MPNQQKTGMSEKEFKLIIKGLVKRQLEIIFLLVIFGCGVLSLIKQYLPATPNAVMILFIAVFVTITIALLIRIHDEINGYNSNRSDDEMTKLNIEYKDLDHASIFKVHDYIISEVNARK